MRTTKLIDERLKELAEEGSFVRRIYTLGTRVEERDMALEILALRSREREAVKRLVAKRRKVKR